MNLHAAVMLRNPTRATPGATDANSGWGAVGDEKKLRDVSFAGESRSGAKQRMQSRAEKAKYAKEKICDLFIFFKATL